MNANTEKPDAPSPGWKRQGGWLFGATATQQVVATLALFWLARKIDVEDWGRFALDAATLGLFGTFGTAKLNILGIRMDGATWEAGDGRRILGAVRSEGLVYFLVASAWFAWRDRLDAGTVALLVGLPLRHVAQQSRMASERIGRYGPLARLETLALFAGHAVAIGAVLRGHPEHALYWREGAVGLLLFGLLTWDLSRARLFTAVPLFVRPSVWWGFLRRSVPAYFDGTIEQVMDRALVLLVGHTAGEYGAGTFFQAKSLAGRPHLLLAPLASRLSLGWLSRQSGPVARRDSTLALVRRFLGWALLAAVLTALVGPPITPLLLGEKWVEAGQALPWFAGFVAGMTLLELIKINLHVDGRLRELVRVRVLQFLLLFLVAGFVVAGSFSPVNGMALAVSIATLGALYDGYRIVARTER